MTVKGTTKPQKHWTMAEIRLLKELFDKGTPYAEISKQLNRGVYSIQYAALKFCDNRPRIIITEEQRQKVLQLRSENIAWWRIADELGFATTTLRKQFGI